MSDKNLDGLDQLAAAYRKLPRPEPSPALDAAILAQARAAVAKPRSRSRWPTWVASAAAVTLAFGLAWRVRERTEMDQPESPFATESAPAPASAPGADSSGGKLKDAPEAPKERQAQDVDASRSDQGFAAEPAAQAPVVVAKPASAEPTPGSEVLARKVVAPPSDSRAQAPVDDLAKQPEPRKTEADRAQAVPVPEPAAAPAAPPPPPPAPMAPARVEETVTFDEALPISEPAPPPEPFQQQDAAGTPAGPGIVEKKQANEAATKEDALGGARRERAAAAGGSRDADGEPEAEGTDEVSATTTTGALGATLQANDARAHSAAIERIRALMRDGRRNDAKRELARFRRDFPNATVPDDLRGLER